MSGTVTTTEDRRAGLCKVKFAWTSDSNGDASGATTYTYSGLPLSLVLDPSGGPTDAYDVVVNDDDGADVLNGLGANASGTLKVTKTNVDGLRAVEGTKLNLVVSAAGDVKTGTVKLTILEL